MRTVFFTSFYAFIGRNIFASDVLRTVVAAGDVRAVIFVPFYKRAFFEAQYGGPNVVIEAIDTTIVTRSVAAPVPDAAVAPSAEQLHAELSKERADFSQSQPVGVRLLCRVAGGDRALRVVTGRPPARPGAQAGLVPHRCIRRLLRALSARRGVRHGFCSAKWTSRCCAKPGATACRRLAWCGPGTTTRPAD